MTDRLNSTPEGVQQKLDALSKRIDELVATNRAQQVAIKALSKLQISNKKAEKQKLLNHLLSVSDGTPTAEAEKILGLS